MDRAETAADIPSAPGWGPRISQLVNTGRLSRDTVQDLIRETGGDDEIGSRETCSFLGIPGVAAGPQATPRLHGAFGSEGSRAAADALDGRVFGKYQIRHLLGAGGMGRVYLAFDQLLNRPVALKFLYGDNPMLVVRLFREARAQAQVDHENVCRVHEVGETEGRPYVAMQYVDGRVLSAVAPEMTLEQKIGVMKDVAEGVHAAHKTGLIHRDLKPGNIMVERTDEGRWKPYVMDFGLARDMSDPGLTTTGVVVGTLAYMAPEQARGEVHALDRRTDVYGLGATLYELLAGCPPFTAGSGAELMVDLLRNDPPAIHKLNPRVPRDLETITMKCLEKEPQRRYDSARALAADLQRYVDGEPVEARPAGWRYRLAKKIRKNRVVAAVVSVAVLWVLASATTGIYVWWSASERARLARQFGQEVERIDSTMRIAALAPLHDTRAQKEVVRKAMHRIEEQMSLLGSSAELPGAYALGRGHIALKEYDSAQEWLEKAWNGGDHEPDVALSLGLVLGKQYEEEMYLLENIRNKEIKEAQRRRIEQQYGGPAVKYLELGREGDGGATSAYVEALIAFYKRDYEDALQRARAVLRRDPLFYEAELLEGDVLISIAKKKREEGDYEGAGAIYEQAERVLSDATRIGESDPAGYLSLGEIHAGMLQIAAYGTGQPLDPYVRAAVDACERALQADPDCAAAYYKLTAVYRRAAENTQRRGRDPTDLIAKALETATKGHDLMPKDAVGWYLVGIARQTSGRIIASRGQDPRPSYDAAITCLTESVAIRPNSESALNSLGVTHWYRGQYDAIHGQDPRNSLNAAIDCFRKTLALSPNYIFAHSNLGGALNDRGSYEATHGIDPRPTLEEASRVFDSGLALNPSLLDLLNNAGTTFLFRADFELSRGEDPQRSADQALLYYDRALAIDPNYRITLLNSVDALRGVIEYRIASGLDAGPALSAARARASKVIDAGDQLAVAFQEMAMLSISEAEIAQTQGSSLSAPLRDARKWIDKAVGVDPELSLPYRLLGRCELLEAQGLVANRVSPYESLRRARAALQKSVQIDQSDAEAYALLAEADLCSAMSRAPADLGQIENDALSGLDHAKKALAINPRLGEGAGAQGGLLLVQAKATADDRKRRELASESAMTLKTAIEMNRLLARRYAPMLDEARRMAETRPAPR
ncbi:MAG: protein kinase [Acidobacteriota bacterium]